MVWILQDMLQYTHCSIRSIVYRIKTILNHLTEQLVGSIHTKHMDIVFPELTACIKVRRHAYSAIASIANNSHTCKIKETYFAIIGRNKRVPHINSEHDVTIVVILSIRINQLLLSVSQHNVKTLQYILYTENLSWQNIQRI